MLQLINQAPGSNALALSKVCQEISSRPVIPNIAAICKRQELHDSMVRMIHANLQNQAVQTPLKFFPSTSNPAKKLIYQRDK